MVHIFSDLPSPPEEFVKELNKIFYDFLWSGKKDKIKRINMIRTYEDGGLRMTDVNSFVHALKLAHLRKCARNPNFISPSHFPLDEICTLGANINIYSKCKNPFWRSVLDSWSSYVKREKHCPENIDYILSQPLWLNHHFKDKTFFIQNWYTKGFHFIKDICNSKGLMTFEEFKMAFDVRGTFLDYHKLLNCIPSEWKQTIYEQFIIAKQNLNISCNLLDLLKPGKGARYFYDRIIACSDYPSVCDKWVKNFNLSSLDWKEIFLQYRRCTKDIKLLEFQFKFLHRIVYTKKELKAMKLINDETCSFCKSNKESLVHVFFWNVNM